jgi:hypothetical protein
MCAFLFCFKEARDGEERIIVRMRDLVMRPSRFVSCKVFHKPVSTTPTTLPARSKNAPEQLSHEFAEVNSLLGDKVECQFASIPAGKKRGRYMYNIL